MSIAGATEFTYAQGGGTVNYGVLNGRCMTVYVDQYGDLGLRTFLAGSPIGRSAGIANAVTGYPDDNNIDTTGQILPSANPPTYAILRSLTDRSVEDTIQIAIMGRRELITVGAGSVCASWGVYSDHADLSFGIVGVDGTPTAFSVSGATATDTLAATSEVMLYDSLSADLLEVTNTYSFQNDATDLEQIRIKVEVTLRNAHATDTIDNLIYGFGIDPNPNVSTGSDDVYFMSSVDSDAFAVEVTSSGNWTVGLAVYETEGAGSILGFTTNTNEGSLPRSFDTEVTTSDNIRLGTGTNADLYAGSILVDSTTDFKTDAAWRAGLPTDSGNRAIWVVSPTYDLSPGDSQTFTFYILTGPQVAAAAASGASAFAYVS